MYSSDDIQEMIQKCKESKSTCKKVLDEMTNYADWRAVQHVISEGCYETFDRYDSDVCEQFISAYEKATREEG